MREKSGHSHVQLDERQKQGCGSCGGAESREQGCDLVENALEPPQSILIALMPRRSSGQPEERKPAICTAMPCPIENGNQRSDKGVPTLC